MLKALVEFFFFFILNFKGRRDKHGSATPVPTIGAHHAFDKSVTDGSIYVSSCWALLYGPAKWLHGQRKGGRFYIKVQNMESGI